MISIVVAMAENGVIGKTGGLPWRLPGEMAYFKKTTMGHPLVMGRKTYESIGRPLPGRTSIVISGDKNYKAEGCQVVNSLDAALKAAGQAEGSDEIFVIGGESVYEQALPKADRLYLTDVQAAINGDRFFKFKPGQWREVWSEAHKADADNQYGYVFRRFERSQL